MIQNKNNVLFSSKSDEWSTPQEVFDELDSEFSFTLDPCANNENHKCQTYYTEEENGLSKSWGGNEYSVIRRTAKLEHGYANAMRNH